MSNNPTPAIDDDEIDLLALFAALWQGKWLIFLITVIFIVLAGVYVRLSVKVYQADALIQIERKQTGASLSQALEALSGGGVTGGRVSGQEELIKSRLILGQTVDEFGLTTRLQRVLPLTVASVLQPPAPPLESQVSARLIVPDEYWAAKERPKLTITFRSEQTFDFLLDDEWLMAGEVGVIAEKNGYQLLVDAVPDKTVILTGVTYQLLKSSRLAAINSLRGGLAISEKGKDSGFYQLTLTGSDPKYAQTLLNNIATNYVRESIKSSTEEAQASIDFIEQQLPELNASLHDAEQALNDYMLRNNSVDLSLEAQTKISSLAQIESQLSALTLKEDELSRRFTRQHPQYQALLSQRQSLMALKNDINRELRAAPETQQGIIRLKRNVEVNQQIYLQLLSKVQELRIIAAANVGSVRVIDGAQVQQGIVKPKAKIVLAIAGMLGLVLGSLLILLRVMLRQTINSVDDVVNHTGLPVLATIPASKKQEGLERRIRRSKHRLGESSILSISSPDDLSVEAIRSLRTSLHFAVGNARNNLVMVSGATEDVGKSFVSSNVAALLAEAGKKVVLIDMDMRKSYLSRQFLLQEGKKGLSDYLSKSELETSDVLHQTAIENMTFIPCGDFPKNPSELLMSPRLATIFTHLSERYDIIVLDTPPVLAVTDASIIGQHAGTTMLVAKHNVSSVRELEFAVAKLNQSNINVNGVVINGIIKTSRYGGNYSYGYGIYGYKGARN